MVLLFYTSRSLRFFVLVKFKSYRKLSNGFCSFDQWDEKLTQNFFDLLNKLYLDLDNCVFDFEYYTLKLRKVKRHLSLFFICIHYMRCIKSCDKLRKSKYNFYCSRVRMSDFAYPSNFYNIDMDPHNYSENIRNLMEYSTVDLDIQQDPMPSFDNALKRSSTLCEQFEVYTRPGHICVSFLSVLVRMYINYVMEALSDLDVTLKDEEKSVGYVYNYASQNLMDFWDCNGFFFYDFFKNFPYEIKEMVCFAVQSECRIQWSLLMN